MAWHHKECWAEHGACSTCGAQQKTAPAAVVVRPTPPQYSFPNPPDPESEQIKCSELHCTEPGAKFLTRPDLHFCPVHYRVHYTNEIHTVRIGAFACLLFLCIFGFALFLSQSPAFLVITVPPLMGLIFLLVKQNKMAAGRPEIEKYIQDQLENSMKKSK